MKKDPKVMIMGLDATGKVESILQPARPGRTAQPATVDQESAKVEERLRAPGYL